MEKLESMAGVEIPGGEDSRKNCLAGPGSLTGISVGGALGLVGPSGFRLSLVPASFAADIYAMASSMRP